MRKKVMIYFIILLFILIGAFIIWQMTAYKVDEPKYSILKSDNSIEIRSYPALMVAEVTMQGERYKAINSGFKILADYIFGNNKEKQPIAMTAPVMQKGMTESHNDMGDKSLQDNVWAVRFVMPANFDANSIPHPNNASVKIINLPSKNYVVIRFSGSNSDKNLQDHLAKLIEYNKKHDLKVTGEPIMAFYNPPWILPFLRRNEIMLELENFHMN